MTARLGLIGGYLGSGKTTLVNRLLAGVLPGRTAVVVNDFGSVNIDADLVVSASEDTIELTNGCICCHVTDDVTRTMTALAAREDLDHVLCEVSGVGNPGQLAAWQDFPGFSPGPVLVCAAATAVHGLLHNEYVGDTAALQLAAADVVLVTKTDLAPSSETEEAVRSCRSAAPRARLVVQDPGDPGSSAVEAFSPGPADLTDTGSARRTHAALGADCHAGTHESLSLGHLRVDDVTAFARTLGEQSDLLVRAKGMIQDAHGEWHHLQLSGGRVDLQPRAADRPEPDHPALVLIAAGPRARDDVALAATRISGTRIPR